MKGILLLLFAFSSLSVASADVLCHPPMSLTSFNEILWRTKDAYFPELKNEKIILKTFRSDAYFLQAQPEIKTLIGKRNLRVYSVQLNLKLLDCPPSNDALEAILVHELEHVKDYTKWSAAKIAKHGFYYASSLDFKKKYERQTDKKTLEKGLHLGLAGYRDWVYQWLTPKDLKRKRFIYLTPEEILGH
jgi:hypothetical protein